MTVLAFLVLRQKKLLLLTNANCIYIKLVHRKMTHLKIQMHTIDIFSYAIEQMNKYTNLHYEKCAISPNINTPYAK